MNLVIVAPVCLGISKMRNLGIVAICAALLLAGCAAMTISVPVTGQINGVAAAGQAVGHGDGAGTFWAQIPGGMRCDGTYDSLDQNPSFVVPVTCSNGTTGEMVVTRAPDLVSGSGIVALSDGSKGQFVFGNLKFDQAFGAGGVAVTQPLQRKRLE